MLPAVYIAKAFFKSKKKKINEFKRKTFNDTERETGG
jgi:hypothetical protein